MLGGFGSAGEPGKPLLERHKSPKPNSYRVSEGHGWGAFRAEERIRNVRHWTWVGERPGWGLQRGWAPLSLFSPQTDLDMPPSLSF